MSRLPSPEPAGAAATGRWREQVLVTLGGAVLGLVAIWPVLSDLGDTIIGDEKGEAAASAWVLWWGQERMLETGWVPDWAPLVNWPIGRAIHCLPLLLAIVALPLRPFTDAVSLYNVTIGLQVALAFWGAWVLLRRAGASPWTALPGAVAYATTPAFVSILPIGPVESYAVGWMPLALWAGLEAMARGGALRLAVAALLLGGTFLANPYFFVFTAPVLAALAALEAHGRPWGSTVARAAATGAGATLVLLPQALAISRSAGLSPRDSDPYMAWELLHLVYTQDLLSFLLPTTGFYHHDPPIRVYLGLALLGLALVGIGRPGWRRWGGVALATLIFALGPWLEVGGWRAAWGETPLSMPADFLCAYVPPFTSVSHPFRITPLVVLALGVLAAMGLARAPARYRPVLAVGATLAVLADNLAVAPVAFPLTTTPMRIPEFYRELAHDPERYAVVDFLGRGGPLNFGPGLVYQTVHHKGVVFDVAPPSRPLVDNSIVRLAETAIDDEPPEMGADLCLAAAELERAQVRYVVAHRWTDEPDPRIEVLGRCGLPELRLDEQVRVLRVVATEESRHPEDQPLPADGDR